MPVLFPAGADQVEIEVSIPNEVPLTNPTEKVEYILKYELYETNGDKVRSDFLFDGHGIMGSHARGETISAGDTLASFELITLVENNPIIAQYNMENDLFFYTMTNKTDLVLPPYSAIYVAERIALPFPIEEDYYTYNFGGKVLVANHTNQEKTIRKGTVEYNFLSQEQPNRSTTLHVRLTAFDGDFDESEGAYQTAHSNRKILFQDQWLQLK